MRFLNSRTIRIIWPFLGLLAGISYGLHWCRWLCFAYLVATALLAIREAPIFWKKNKKHTNKL